MRLTRFRYLVYENKNMSMGNKSIYIMHFELNASNSTSSQIIMNERGLEVGNN